MLLLWCGEASSGQLAQRLASFPNWEGKPAVQVAQGDLVYPAWMMGTWDLTSTLVDVAAPLAPEIVAPGFEGNRRYLDRPVKFSGAVCQKQFTSGIFKASAPACEGALGSGGRSGF